MFVVDFNEPSSHWSDIREAVITMATVVFSSVWRGCTGKGPSHTDETPFVTGQKFVCDLHHKGEYSHEPYSYSVLTSDAASALQSIYRCFKATEVKQVYEASLNSLKLFLNLESKL